MGGSKIGLFIAPVLIAAMALILYRKGAVSRTAAITGVVVTLAIAAVLMTT